MSFRAALSDTSTARDAAELVKEGVVRETSFSFSADDDQWTDWKGGLRHRFVRTINGIRELSLVTAGAYGSAATVEA